MTERLYYHDSYMRRFEASVVKAEETARGYEVVLDATAFYPTSGGQPHDLGFMAGARIQEVVERDDEIVHRLDVPVAPERLDCQIDWDRRFDHMQQHTGQHVLSQAFVRAAKRNTVGFHMGAGESYAPMSLDQKPSASSISMRLSDWRTASSTRTAPLRCGSFQSQKYPHSVFAKRVSEWGHCGSSLLTILMFQPAAALTSSGREKSAAS